MTTRVTLRPATALNQSADPRVLGTLVMPGVAAALWQRPTDPLWQAWLDALPASQLPRLRQTLRPQDVARAATAACEASRLPGSPQRQRLIDDIAELAILAARHLDSLLVTLRIEAHAGQSCPKWHLDGVRARLLCTLRGPGTQFGPASGTAQVAAHQQVPTGAAALFRGRDWGAEPSGLLHRSPPAQPGQMRLLVVVDPVAEAASC